MRRIRQDFQKARACSSFSSCPLLFFPPPGEEEGRKRGGPSKEEDATKSEFLVNFEED